MTSQTTKSADSPMANFLRSLKLWFGSLHDKPNWRIVFSAMLFSLVLAALFFTVYSVRQQSVLEVGKPSPKLYKSTIDTVMVNQLETEKRRRAATEQVDDVYVADEQVQVLVVEAIQTWDLSDGIKQFVTEVYSQPDGVSEEGLANTIEQVLERVVEEDNALTEAAEISESEISSNIAIEATEQSETENSITDEDDIVTEEEVVIVPLEVRLADARALLERDLLATTIVDLEATEEAKTAVADSIEQVEIEVQAGETIVAEGRIITSDHLRILEELGLYTPARDSLLRTILRALGSLLLGVLLTICLLYSYPFLLQKFGKRQIALLAILILLLLVLQRLAFMVHPAFIIVALAPIIISVVHSQVVAVAVAAWLSLVVALIVPEAPVFTLVTSLAATVVAALTTRLLHSRTSLLLSGLLGGAVAVCAALGYSLLVADIGGSTLLAISYILFGSIIAAFFALGSLPLLESNFG